MAGRRPKPTHLRAVEGNRGRRPLPKGEPKPKRAAPAPPKHLSSAAKAAWPRLVEVLARMGVLTEADGFALERLAECYAEVLECQELIREHGRTYESVTYGKEGGENVMVRPRPEVGQLADADRRFRGYLIEFGLTPAARTKVQGSGSEEEDPLEKFLG